MIRNHKVVYLVPILVLLCTASLHGQAAQTDPPQATDPVAQLDQMIDAEVAGISDLEQALGDAVDKGDEEAVERIREQIRTAWARVESLKELKEAIGTKPRRSYWDPQSPGQAGDDEKPKRAFGALSVEGKRPDEVEREETTNERPELARPSGESPRNRKGAEQGTPPRERPKLARPGGEDRPARQPGKRPGDKTDPGTIDDEIRKCKFRIDMLMDKYLELMEAGRIEESAATLEQIVEEKRLLRDLEAQAQAGDMRPEIPPLDSNAADPRDRSGDRRGAKKAPPSPPADAQTTEEMKELIGEMQEEIRALREELQRLREQQGDSSGDSKPAENPKGGSKTRRDS
jgi:hypothetical protein